MIRASDATAWKECPRIVWYNANPPANLVAVEPSELDKLVVEMGNRHEWAVKRGLEKLHQVVEAVSEEHTRALMQAKAEVIYQAKLSNNDVIGYPDFLILHSSGEYQPADAKLARKEDKQNIQIQLGVYRVT